VVRAIREVPRAPLWRAALRRCVSARGNGRNAKITTSSARYGGRDRVRPRARTGSDIISIRSFVSVVSPARDRFLVARARLCGKRLDRNYIGLCRAALIAGPIYASGILLRCRYVRYVPSGTIGSRASVRREAHVRRVYRAEPDSEPDDRRQSVHYLFFEREGASSDSTGPIKRYARLPRSLAH